MEYEAVTADGCASCRGGADRYEPSVITYPTFTLRFTYDLRGRKQAEYEVLSDTEEYVTQYEYDLVGNLIKQIDKESNQTQYQYDSLNRRTRTKDALDGETTYTYDDRDNLIALQDANGNVTRFEYDRNNRKTKEIRLMGEESVYAYDGRGNLISKIDPKGQKTEHVYDDAGRRIEIRYYAAGDHAIPVKTVTFTYDKIGNLLSYDDGTTSGQYGYDDLYRKTSETVDYGSFSLGHTYTYYRNGLKQSFTGPDGVTYEYRYDENKQLAEVVIPAVGSINYNSYTWTRPQSITLAGGTKKQYTYDPLMRVKSISVTDPGLNSIMDYQYSYDRMGNILTKSTEHGVYTYGYDKTYQLTSADNPTLPDEAFTYDPVGNRLTSADLAGLWDYNANNELLSYNDTSFEYDANGNTIKKAVGPDPLTAQVTNYTYNIEDRLAGVDNGSVIASYYYDPFGRRLWKEVDGVRTYFAYANEGLVAEADQLGNVVTSYGFQPESEWSTAPFFMNKGTAYYFYQNDHLGTPVSITNSTGAAEWSADFDAFGSAIINPSSEVSSNLRFPGQYYYEESQLHYNYQRYYDANAGRYLSTDPIGFEGGDPNLYTYGLNDSVNYYDPSGEIIPFIAGAAYEYAQCVLLCSSVNTLADQFGGILCDFKEDNCVTSCLNPLNWLPIGKFGRAATKLERLAAKEVILDTDAVIRFKDAQKLLKPGEVPVITPTTVAELKALVSRGKLKGMPGVLKNLKVIKNAGSVISRIAVREAQTKLPGKVKGSLFGDGVIGGTAIDTNKTLITFDKKLRAAVQSLGGYVR
jgi:RHS repeat-associated protein